MATPLSGEIKALVDGPNFAHLATLLSDGAPQSDPVWVSREGDRILICTGEGSVKGRNTRRDPRVALSIVSFHNPYEEAQLPISRKYTGKPFPMRGPEGRVALIIEIEKARYTKLPFEHTPAA